MNGAGAAGLATVFGSAKLGDSALGGEGDTKDENGFCAGSAETAAGNGGGPFKAGAAGTAGFGNGGGPLRRGAAAGTATDRASTDTVAAAGGAGADTTTAARFAGADATAAADGAGEGCEAAGLVGLGRGGGAAGFTGPGRKGRGCSEGSDERTRTDDSESNGGGGAARGAIAGRGGGLIDNVK